MDLTYAYFADQPLEPTMFNAVWDQDDLVALGVYPEVTAIMYKINAQNVVEAEWRCTEPNPFMSTSVYTLQV